MPTVFREVVLPPGAPGSLHLHSMPGVWEPLDAAWDEVRARGVSTIVCLAGTDEIERKSPAYSAALRAGGAPCAVRQLPVGDFDVPEDRDGWLALTRSVADLLRSGERVLVHCGAGVGRTGTFAVCVLLALGLTPEQAGRTVAGAGSHPETDGQEQLVRWCARRAAGRS